MTTVRLERALKALANRRRLSLIAYLRDKRKASVGELAAHLHVSFPTVSKHLSILISAGVLENERQGMAVHYRLAAAEPAVIRSILKHLE